MTAAHADDVKQTAERRLAEMFDRIDTLLGDGPYPPHEHQEVGVGGAVAFAQEIEKLAAPYV